MRWNSKYLHHLNSTQREFSIRCRHQVACHYVGNVPPKLDTTWSQSEWASDFVCETISMKFNLIKLINNKTEAMTKALQKSSILLYLPSACCAQNVAGWSRTVCQSLKFLNRFYGLEWCDKFLHSKDLATEWKEHKTISKLLLEILWNPSSPQRNFPSPNERHASMPTATDFW